MGTFEATLDVGDPQGTRYESIDAMVDTGATYSSVPKDVLARLGVTPEFRRQLMTADGRVIERDMAETRVRFDGQQRTTMVVFGDEGSKPLLGAYTLEGFGLAADPLGKRLIPVPGYALTALGGGEECSGELQLATSPRTAKTWRPEGRPYGRQYDPAG